MKHYDIIIIGAGPAGLAAAVYARRADKSVLLLEKNGFTRCGVIHVRDGSPRFAYQKLAPTQPLG